MHDQTHQTDPINSRMPYTGRAFRLTAEPDQAAELVERLLGAPASGSC